MYKAPNYASWSVALTFAVAGSVVMACGSAPKVVSAVAPAAVTRGPALASQEAHAGPSGTAAEVSVKPDLAPVRIRIPAISVDAPVRDAGLTAGGNLPAPTGPSDVDWFKGSPPPGVPGNAIMTGHVDWYGGTSAIFTRLSALRSGDRIEVVGADGASRFFGVDVVRSESLDAKDAGLFQPSEFSTLTLITCAGNWLAGRQTYDQRTLVTARSIP